MVWGTAVMRWSLILCVGASAALLAGCSGCSSSNTETSTAAQEHGASKAVHAFYAAAEDGDVDAMCRLLTENGKEAARLLGSKDMCEGDSSRPLTGPKPQIGPVGANEDLALAVVRYPGKGSYQEENFVTVLRRVDSDWLIDLPLPFPVLKTLDAPGIPPPMVEELPTDGPEVDAARDVATRYTLARQKADGATVCSLLTSEARGDASKCEQRESVPFSEVYRVAEVAVVGDLALAYRTGGGFARDGQTQPDNPGQLQDIVLLVNTAEGWRVDPITFGFA